MRCLEPYEDLYPMRISMRASACVLSIMVLFALPVPSGGQTITSEMRASDRPTNWSQAGVSGDIPNRTTICATFAPGATVTAINNAIAACRNGVVVLGEGTYTLSSGISFRGNSNVTLRGAGPDQTILKFTAADGCGGLWADVCVHGPSNVWSGSVPASNIRSWTGGYARGTTEITLSSTAGLAVGLMIVLDQLDDASDTRDVYVCGSLACSQEGGPAGRPRRAQQQFVQVKAINGNRITVSPGIHMVNWRASQQPQAWWWGESSVMNGVESMTLDHTASGGKAGIGFSNAYDCWVRNVKSLNGNRNHVLLNQAARIEVRDSYFYGTKNAASQSYGVEFFATSDALVVNNIFHHVTAPIMIGNSAGVVVAYNFMTDMYYLKSPNWLMAGLQGTHDAGTGMNLFEGNVSNAFLMDNFHGTGNLATLFRNRLTGTEGSKTSNTVAVNIFALNRFVNIVGNVLGTGGYHKAYETSPAAPQTAPLVNRSIYVLGYSGALAGSARGLPSDALVMSTMLRWGNFDYATNQVRWDPEELPDEVDTPTSRALPPSLFLSARPSWWGTLPWPAIGPDVTGGEDPAGHAHKIPAQACFDVTTRQSDRTLRFDATACYGSAKTVAPRTPTNVIVR